MIVFVRGTAFDLTPDLLSQAARSVPACAAVALSAASQHLQLLRRTALTDSCREASRSSTSRPVAVLQDYFVSYLANMDSIFAGPAAPAAERLLRYFEEFRGRQSADDFQSGCLVVTLGPEAANFTGPMRGELNAGVSQIIDRLECIITAGVVDESMSSQDPRSSAETLYDMWVGASIMAKINRDPATFDITMTATREHLKIAGAVGRQPV